MRKLQGYEFLSNQNLHLSMCYFLGTSTHHWRKWNTLKSPWIRAHKTNLLSILDWRSVKSKSFSIFQSEHVAYTNNQCGQLSTHPYGGKHSSMTSLPFSRLTCTEGMTSGSDWHAAPPPWFAASHSLLSSRQRLFVVELRIQFVWIVMGFGVRSRREKKADPDGNSSHGRIL